MLRLMSAGRIVLTLRPGECASLGRRPLSSVVLRGKTVSRRHAVVRWDGDDPFPKISNISINETRLDGAPLHREGTDLQGGETIEIADYALIATLVTRSVAGLPA